MSTEIVSRDMIDKVCAGMGTQAERDAVWTYITKLKAAVDDWRERYKPSCPEDVYQSDRCSVNATELVEAVFDAAGYYVHAD